jgi:NADH-quinone oxidoreductase subunit F
VRHLEHFYAQEGCGWCTPCWSSLAWCEQILAAMEDGRGWPGDLDALELPSHFNALGHTFCALARGAVEPLQSALEHFR